jgi:aspartyl-tRNA(Asn)/glutamyl-tRNA(Gln) amidotransferase subunit C
MALSKEELLHIAKLSDLKIADDEIDDYLKKVDDILEYTEIINNAPIEGLGETIGANDNYNVFRKDEPVQFDNIPGIMANCEETERNNLCVELTYDRDEDDVHFFVSVKKLLSIVSADGTENYQATGKDEV